MPTFAEMVHIHLRLHSYKPFCCIFLSCLIPHVCSTHLSLHLTNICIWIYFFFEDPWNDGTSPQLTGSNGREIPSEQGASPRFGSALLPTNQACTELTEGSVGKSLKKFLKKHLGTKQRRFEKKGEGKGERKVRKGNRKPSNNCKESSVTSFCKGIFFWKVWIFQWHVSLKDNFQQEIQHGLPGIGHVELDQLRQGMWWMLVWLRALQFGMSQSWGGW